MKKPVINSKKGTHPQSASKSRVRVSLTTAAGRKSSSDATNRGINEIGRLFIISWSESSSAFRVDVLPAPMTRTTRLDEESWSAMSIVGAHYISGGFADGKANLDHRRCLERGNADGRQFDTQNLDRLSGGQALD